MGKQVTVVSLSEVQRAILAELGRRPTMRGRFIAAVYAIADDHAPADLKIRFNVVSFDTEKAARAYQEAPEPIDVPVVTPTPAAAPEAAP